MANFFNCNLCGLTVIAEETESHRCKRVVDYRIEGDILWLSDGDKWYPRKLTPKNKHLLSDDRIQADKKDSSDEEVYRTIFSNIIIIRLIDPQISNRSELTLLNRKDFCNSERKSARTRNYFNNHARHHAYHYGSRHTDPGIYVSMLNGIQRRAHNERIKILDIGGVDGSFIRNALEAAMDLDFLGFELAISMLRLAKDIVDFSGVL